MLTTELFARIEAMAPLAGACSWDTSGVQVASPKEHVTRLALMLDATPAQVQRALAWGADVILAHHPLALKPRFLHTADAYFHIVRLLIQADCWCYAAHTSLDAQVHGPEAPAGWLARELALADLTILEPTLPDGSAGIGCLGRLPSPLPWPEFVARLTALLPGACIRRCGPAPQFVGMVGYCGGSGSSLADAAFARGADVFITGDVKYHTALDADTAAAGCLLDVGHFSIEEEMMRRLSLLLEQQLPPQAGLSIRFFPGQDPFHTVHPGPIAFSQDASR